MANPDVRIRLSADTQSLHSELRLLDRELRGLGRNPANSHSSNSQSSSSAGSNNQAQTNNSAESSIPKDEGNSEPIPRGQSSNSAMNNNPHAILRETLRIRRLLQKLVTKFTTQNPQQGFDDNSSSNPSENSDSSNSPQNSNPNNNDSNNNNGNNNNNNNNNGNNNNNNNGNPLGDIAASLLTVGTVVKSLTSAISYMKTGASDSASGESLAYKTYGSVLAYNDYYTAKTDATNIGVPYGYDYKEVMDAGSTNMSSAGFTNLQDYNKDMTAILASSKAWGINTSSLAGVSGYMTSIGVTKNGDQKKFTNMLAESIVDANMSGREDEQLQVLETISENLAKTLVKVDANSLDNVMGLYTSLANNNSELRGARGASIVESINDSITNGSSTLDVLLGWGTKYTGLSGKVELSKLKEQGLSNPETLATIFKNFEVYTGKSIDSDAGQMFLSNQLGLSYSQVEALLKSKDEIMSGNYDSSMLDGTGQAETDARNDNYTNADVSTQEQYNIETQSAKESAGETYNNIANPFRDWYNGLSDGGQVAVDATVGAGKLIGGIALGKLAGAGLGKLFAGAGASGAGAGAAAGAGSAGAGLMATAGKVLPVAGLVAEAAAAIKIGTNIASGETMNLDEGGMFKGIPLLEDIAKASYGVQQSISEKSQEDARKREQQLNALQESITQTFDRNTRDLQTSFDKTIKESANLNNPQEVTQFLVDNGYNVNDVNNMNSEERKEEAQAVADKAAKKSEALDYFQNAGTSTPGEDYANYTAAKSRGDRDVMDIYMKSIAWKAMSYSNATGEDKYDNEAISALGITDEEDKTLLKNTIYEYSLDYNARKAEYEKADKIFQERWKKAEELAAANPEKYSDPRYAYGDANPDCDPALRNGTELVDVYTKDDGSVHLAYTWRDEEGNLSSSEYDARNYMDIPKYSTGLANVPYDNYLAYLHKGERVLTSTESAKLSDVSDMLQRTSQLQNLVSLQEFKSYSDGNSDFDGTSSVSQTLDINIKLDGNIEGIDANNQNRIVEAIIAQLSRSNLQSTIANGFIRVQNN